MKPTPAGEAVLAALALLPLAATGGCNRDERSTGPPDPLALAARARGGERMLGETRGVRGTGTTRFAEEGPDAPSHGYEFFLVFPDRARFDFRRALLRRTLFLSGEEAFEQREGSATSTPLSEADRESLAWTAFVHAVLARFPFFGNEGTVETAPPHPPGRIRLRVRWTGREALALVSETDGMLLEVETPDSPDSLAIAVETWAERGGARWPRRIRARVSGAPAWEAEIEAWVPDPVLGEAFFRPSPGGGTGRTEIHAAPTPSGPGSVARLLEPRLVRVERMVERDGSAVDGWAEVAREVARRHPLPDGTRIVVTLGPDGASPSRVAACELERGSGGSERAEAVEMFARGNPGAVPDWVDRLGRWCREAGRTAEGPPFLTREPNEWAAEAWGGGTARIWMHLETPR